MWCQNVQCVIQDFKNVCNPIAVLSSAFCLTIYRARVQLIRDGTRWRREGKWRGNWRMEWVASTLHTTSELGVSSITTADPHTSVASSRLNWRLCGFKWTRPFRRKTIWFLRVCHHILNAVYQHYIWRLNTAVRSIIWWHISAKSQYPRRFHETEHFRSLHIVRHLDDCCIYVCVGSRRNKHEHSREQPNGTLNNAYL